MKIIKVLFIISIFCSLVTVKSFCQDTLDNHRWHEQNEKHDRRYHSPYLVSNDRVFFNGRRVDGATASSFAILKDGYAKDKWNVYYCGEKLKGATSNSFEALGYGYAKDKWNVYFDGEKIKGASPNGFKVLYDGYAEDKWNTYYWGRKI